MTLATDATTPAHELGGERVLSAVWGAPREEAVPGPDAAGPGRVIDGLRSV